MFVYVHLVLLDVLMLSGQVCLQKEQENRVQLELHVTELEEKVDTQSKELVSVRQTEAKLQEELEAEREAKMVCSTASLLSYTFCHRYFLLPYCHQLLQNQVSEMTSKQDSPSDTMRRSYSFTSSDMQVCSHILS